MINAKRFFRKLKATQEMIMLPQPQIQYVQPVSKFILRLVQYVPKPTPIPEIDKKIKAYQKLMERERQEKLLRVKQEQERLLETEDEQKRGLEFMTNPQIQAIEVQEEETQQEEMETIVQDQKPQQTVINQEDNKCSYSEAVKKREKIYDHTLQRMYEKRQNPALFAVHYSYSSEKLKKKSPILNITLRNKITKGHGRMDPEEHRLRVYNRENVPVMPELIIPSFTIKKDQMAKNILAYLKEYTPLFRGYKNYEYPKCVQNILQEEIESLPNQ